MFVKSHYFYGFLLTALISLNSLQTTQAQTDTIERYGPSGLPVPRFVHLKASETWGRVGPSFDHPVRYELHQKNMPMRVIAETRDNNWRKVEDPDGETMWIHRSQLISAPKALIIEAEGVSLKTRPAHESATRAFIEHGVLVTYNTCAQNWCEIRTGAYKGYVPQHSLWGIDS